MIQINCPPMYVRNTGWGPRSDRRCDELPCTGFFKRDGHIVRFVEPEIADGRFVIDKANRCFRFESCLVKCIDRDNWMVDEVKAWGYGVDGSYVEIQYPKEPVKAKGPFYQRLMYAQPIDNHLISSFVRFPTGVEHAVQASLPEAIGRPQGLFGLFAYLVDAVTIKGEVL